MNANQYGLLHNIIELHITHEQQNELMWHGFVIKPIGGITKERATEKRDEIASTIAVIRKALKAFEEQYATSFLIDFAAEMRQNLEHE